MTPPLLALERVSKTYPSVRALRAAPPRVALAEVDLVVARGERVALVGESGAGKSTLGRLALGLEPPSAGVVRFDGAALGTTPPLEVRRRIQAVFQDPLGSLSPVHEVASIVGDPLVLHGRVSRAGRDAAVAAWLARVGLDAAQLHTRPRRLSGGQRQRVAIARALALEPDLLVLDEPTSALDASLVAQIVALLASLHAVRPFASLFVTHDLALVPHVASRVVVLAGGRVVEDGPVAEVFAAPRAEETRRLLAARRALERGSARPGG